MVKNKSWYFFGAILIIVGLIYFSINNVTDSTINEVSDTSKVESSSKETCLNCHINTSGYSSYHNPELIGCASCHLGNTISTDKEESHKGMILYLLSMFEEKYWKGFSSNHIRLNEIKYYDAYVKENGDPKLDIDKFINTHQGLTQSILFE